MKREMCIDDYRSQNAVRLTPGPRSLQAKANTVTQDQAECGRHGEIDYWQSYQTNARFNLEFGDPGASSRYPND